MADSHGELKMKIKSPRPTNIFIGIEQDLLQYLLPCHGVRMRAIMLEHLAQQIMSIEPMLCH